MPKRSRFINFLKYVITYYTPVEDLLKYVAISMKNRIIAVMEGNRGVTVIAINISNSVEIFNCMAHKYFLLAFRLLNFYVIK